MANSFRVRLKCPYGDHEVWMVLQDRKETLIQILATPWDFKCQVHGVQRALPLEAREQRGPSRRMTTQARHWAPTWKSLALVAAVVLSAIALWRIVLFVRDSRHSQSAIFAPPAQLVAAEAVATVQELAEPWSSKTFSFHNPETKQTIASIVVRLPDRASDQPGSYWAFSLKPMFGNCQLEYVTDLQKLSSDYGFQAKHPMVGDPCSRAVFDPLEMADISKGAWARGAIVKGHAFRPPLAIEIQIQSDQLVAAKME